MSVKYKPGAFNFDFGSTVTILTSVATGKSNGRHNNSLGVFTGVVLDETELNLKQDTREVTVTVSSVVQSEESKHKEDDGCNYGYEDDCGCDIKKSNHGKEAEWKPDCEKDHYYEDKHDSEKDCFHGKKHDCEKDHCHVKKHKEEEFLVISLTCPSYPFNAGQIVWISLDQIVAFTVTCRS